MKKIIIAVILLIVLPSNCLAYEPFFIDIKNCNCSINKIDYIKKEIDFYIDANTNIIYLDYEIDNKKNSKSINITDIEVNINNINFKPNFYYYNEDNSAFLKNIIINNHDLSPKFDKYNNNYSITMLKDEELNISYVADSINSNVIIKETINQITLEVKNQKNFQKYIIYKNYLTDKVSIDLTKNKELTIQGVYKDKKLIIKIISLLIVLSLIIFIIIFKKRKK